MAFIRPVQRSIYRVFNPRRLKFFSRLRLGISHLKEHIFRHNFKDCINPWCYCNWKVEDTLYFFLHRKHYSTFSMGLMNQVSQINENFLYLSDDNKVRFLFHGDWRFDDNKYNFIWQASINYILEAERHLTSLFCSNVWSSF